jgi:tetratricopeptide (TPR) repeat protein
LFAVAALLLMPSTYLDARRRHDASELQSLLEQSRLGEAQTLTRRMLLLTPDAEFDGRPLKSLAAGIGQATRELEARATRPLPAGADERQRLDRARDLAMLGRTDAALDAVQRWPEWLHSAFALNLCGTIQETNGHWREGLACYQAAARAWESSPPSPERMAGLVRATTGAAYCLRKSGRYAEAETAYLQLLALSPSADTHFLLARFYEDMQQTAKARTHAKLAMAAAPERYQRQGQRLLEKLNTLHFGCLSGLFDR